MQRNRIYTLLILLFSIASSCFGAGWTDWAWDVTSTNDGPVQKPFYFIQLIDTITRESTTNYIPAETYSPRIAPAYYRSTNASYFGYSSAPSMPTNYWIGTNTIMTHCHIYAPKWLTNTVWENLSDRTFITSTVFVVNGITNYSTTTITRTQSGTLTNVWINGDRLRVYESAWAIQERIWACIASGLNQTYTAERAQTELDDGLNMLWYSPSPSASTIPWSIWRMVYPIHDLVWYYSGGYDPSTNIILFGSNYPSIYMGQTTIVDGNDFANILQKFKTATLYIIGYFTDLYVTNEFGKTYSEWYTSEITPTDNIYVGSHVHTNLKSLYLLTPDYNLCAWWETNIVYSNVLSAPYDPTPIRYERKFAWYDKSLAGQYTFQNDELWIAGGNADYFSWTPTKHAFSLYSPGGVVTQKTRIIPNYISTNANDIFTNTISRYYPVYVLESNKWESQATLIGTQNQEIATVSYNYYVITNRATPLTEADYGWCKLKDYLCDLVVIDTQNSWLSYTSTYQNAYGENFNEYVENIIGICQPVFDPTNHYIDFRSWALANIKEDTAVATQFLSSGSCKHSFIGKLSGYTNMEFSSVLGKFYSAYVVPFDMEPEITTYAKTNAYSINPDEDVYASWEMVLWIGENLWDAGLPMPAFAEKSDLFYLHYPSVTTVVYNAITQKFVTNLVYGSGFANKFFEQQYTEYAGSYSAPVKTNIISTSLADIQCVVYTDESSKKDIFRKQPLFGDIRKWAYGYTPSGDLDLMDDSLRLNPDDARVEIKLVIDGFFQRLNYAVTNGFKYY